MKKSSIPPRRVQKIKEPRVNMPVTVTVVYRMGSADYPGKIVKLTKTTITVEYDNGVDTTAATVNRETKRSKNGIVFIELC